MDTFVAGVALMYFRSLLRQRQQQGGRPEGERVTVEWTDGEPYEATLYRSGRCDDDDASPPCSEPQVLYHHSDLRQPRYPAYELVTIDDNGVVLDSVGEPLVYVPVGGPTSDNLTDPAIAQLPDWSTADSAMLPAQRLTRAFRQRRFQSAAAQINSKIDSKDSGHLTHFGTKSVTANAEGSGMVCTTIVHTRKCKQHKPWCSLCYAVKTIRFDHTTEPKMSMDTLNAYLRSEDGSLLPKHDPPKVQETWKATSAYVESRVYALLTREFFNAESDDQWLGHIVPAYHFEVDEASWYMRIYTELVPRQSEGTSLYGVLRNANPHDNLAMMFQITFSLAKIQQRYPDFRHNDMHGENVLVSITAEPVTYAYDIAGKTYYLNTRYRILMFDFDFASCPSAGVKNPKAASFLRSYLRKRASDDQAADTGILEHSPSNPPTSTSQMFDWRRICLTFCSPRASCTPSMKEFVLANNPQQPSYNLSNVKGNQPFKSTKGQLANELPFDRETYHGPRAVLHAITTNESGLMEVDGGKLLSEVVDGDTVVVRMGSVE